MSFIVSLCLRCRQHGRILARKGIREQGGAQSLHWRWTHRCRRTPGVARMSSKGGSGDRVHNDGGDREEFKFNSGRKFESADEDLDAISAMEDPSYNRRVKEIERELAREILALDDPHVDRKTGELLEGPLPAADRVGTVNLETELDDLANELGYRSGEEMLDVLNLPPPETVGNVMLQPDMMEEHSNDPSAPAYKGWRPDPEMSNEKTATLLAEPVAIDGVVTTGFGRGSAQLGFPTANIEAGVLGITVASLDNGVYIGWARVDDENRLHRAVVNIGYNPTFGDVKKRMVEAHLLSDLESFYGSRLRLVIMASLRKERKFNGVAELVRNIKNDILTAVILFRRTDIRAYRNHPLLTSETTEAEITPDD